MPIPLSAEQVLDREFLEMRAKILELAASFDRLDRADGDVGDDVRAARLLEALAITGSSQPGRAERIQLLFSRAYQDNWKQSFGLSQPQ